MQFVRHVLIQRAVPQDHPLRPTKSVSMTVNFPVSAKKNRPVTQQVDYFSFHFDEIDLHATWRKACHTTKKAKNWNIHIQGKRRENACWRRYFQERENLPKFGLKSLDWQKVKETRGSFYGPFYSSDEAMLANSSDTSSLHTLHSRVPSESSLSPSPSFNNCTNTITNNIKPVLKRKFHSKLHIGTGKTNHRRTCSESVIYEERKACHFLPCRSPDTPSPKEIVLQYFGGENSSSTPKTKHISFNSNDEEWVFDSKPVSQEICISPIVDERFRSLQALINEEFELKMQMQLSKESQILNEEQSESIDDTNTATPFDATALCSQNPMESLVNDYDSHSIDQQDGEHGGSIEPEIIVPLRQASPIKYRERICTFINHMACDKDYMADIEFLDYPDEEIAELLPECLGEVPEEEKSNFKIAPSLANDGIIRLGLDFTFSLISTPWW